jgi:hypothetical protein
MTPPNVLGAANPTSSVIMSSMFGAPFGGTMRGGHHGFDWEAFSLITPPNGSGGAGSSLPSIVRVASGEPGTPVISWATGDVFWNKMNAEIIIRKDSKNELHEQKNFFMTSS